MKWLNAKGEEVPFDCSFCGKNQKDVKKLIAGPLVYICDGCVEIYSKPGRPEASAPSSCGFCGKIGEESRNLMVGPKINICGECIDLCNDILGEERRRGVL